MGTEQSLLSCYCTNKTQQPFQQSAVIQLTQNSNIFIIRGKLNFNKQSTFKKLQIAATEYCSSMRIGVQYVPVVMRLLAYGQENVFNAMKTLSSENARVRLIESMCRVDLDMMDSLYQYMVLGNNQQNTLSNNSNRTRINHKQITSLKPLSIANLTLSDRIQLTTKGQSLLIQGKVAILIMCAGPSSRFHFQDKFLHAIQIENRTILAVLFEKLRGNLKVSNKKQLVDLPIVLIGNQNNTEAIEGYLKENQFFYFNKDSIYFSTIPSLPILDKHGKLCMNFEYNYLSRPQGSACCIQQITTPQALNILIQRGIEYVHVVGSENLGESPGDPVFIGLGAMLKRNVAIKCTRLEGQMERQMFDEIDCENGRIKIIRVSKQLQYHDTPAQEIKQQHYIPMYSMLFELKSLPQLVQKFNTTSNCSYRRYQITQNFYDFGGNKPVIGEKCFTFEKDIKDTIMVAQRPLVVEVGRGELIPILTPNDHLSIDEGVERYLQLRKMKERRQRSEQFNNNQLRTYFKNSNKNNYQHMQTE